MPSAYIVRAREALLAAMDTAITHRDVAAECALRQALYRLPPVVCEIFGCNRAPAIAANVCERHLAPDDIPREAMH